MTSINDIPLLFWFSKNLILLKSFNSLKKTAQALSWVYFYQGSTLYSNLNAQLKVQILKLKYCRIIVLLCTFLAWYSLSWSPPSISLIIFSFNRWDRSRRSLRFLAIFSGSFAEFWSLCLIGQWPLVKGFSYWETLRSKALGLTKKYQKYQIEFSTIFSNCRVSGLIFDKNVLFIASALD